MTMVGSAVMAKKKKIPADTWKSKPVAIQLRGAAEFKAWVQALADFDATDVSELTERALAAYARQIGFARVRPKR